MKADPKSWMELFIYEMGNPTNAFSVYSVQKSKTRGRSTSAFPHTPRRMPFFSQTAPNTSK